MLSLPAPTPTEARVLMLLHRLDRLRQAEQLDLQKANLESSLIGLHYAARASEYDWKQRRTSAQLWVELKQLRQERET
jgi:hypothetical protein